MPSLPNFDAIENPEVREYMRRKYQAERGVDDARVTQDYGNFANVAGGLVTDFGNSRKQDIVFRNRMADLGKAPQIIKAEQAKWDNGDINDITAQSVMQAKEDVARADKAMSDGQQVTDMAWQDKQRGRQEKEWDTADATRAREMDPASEESQMAQALAGKMMPGRDFSKASAAQLKAAIPSLEKLYSIEQNARIRANDQAQRAADRAAMLEGKRIDRENARLHREAEKDADRIYQSGVKAEETSRKEGEYQAGVKVDGADVKPGFRPTTDDAKKAKAAKAAYDQINSSMNEMDQIYARSGTNLVGADATRMASLRTNVLMAQKELDNLGVLSGQDESLTLDQVPDPTTIWENVKGTFGQDRYKPKADQYRRNLRNKYDAILGATGYTGAGKNAENDTKLPPGTKSSFPMTIRKGKQTTVVDNMDELQEAVKEGWGPNEEPKY